MAVPSEEESLWRAGARLFFTHVRGWLPQAAWFVLILIPPDAWNIHQVGPYYQKLRPIYEKLFDALSAGGPEAQTMQSISDQIAAVPPPSSYADVAVIFVSLVALYFFCVYFFERDPVLAAPKLSLRGMSFAFLRIVQKYVIMIGCPAALFFLGAVLFFVPGAVLTGLLHLDIGTLEIIFTAMVIAMTASGGYFFCRYAMVFPLAIVGDRRALKLSGVLTKGNIIRLVWAYAMITTVMLPPALVIALVPATAGSPPPLTLIELATVVAASQIAIMGLFAAFGCAALAILVREKQAADPSFKLLSST